MLKKLILISFVLYNFNLIKSSSSQYVDISSGSDSDIEESVSSSNFSLKTGSDVEALRDLSSEQLLLQAKILLVPISLRNIDSVTIKTDLDGSYLIGEKLFQDAKSFLQVEYDSLSYSLQTLGSGRIFDLLFELHFDSKDTANSYVDWLKQSYKYALVEVLKQKFELPKEQALKNFENFKEAQKAILDKAMIDLKFIYSKFKSYSFQVFTSGVFLATGGFLYKNRLAVDTFAKKIYSSLVLSAVCINLYTLRNRHLRLKELDALASKFECVLKCINDESLQIDMQSYDSMIAKFMRDFDARSDLFLQKEIQRLDIFRQELAIRPQPRQPELEQRAPGIRNNKDGSGAFSLLGFTSFLKKIIHL